MRQWFVMLAMVVGLVILSACKTSPKDASFEEPPPDPPPTVSTLLDRFGPEPLAQTAEPVPEPQAVYVVERQIWPLNQPANPAWDLVDESVLPESKRALLHRNGIRVGLLSMANLTAFDEQSPSAKIVSRWRTFGSQRMDQLLRRPLRDGQTTVELTQPPDIPQRYTLQAGAAQLLHQAIRGPNNTVALRLLPHHHRIEPTVRVRSHLDTEFDGRMFHELMMTLTPRPDQLVVVGLYWPWSEQQVSIIPTPLTEEQTSSQENATSPEQSRTPENRNAIQVTRDISPTMQMIYTEPRRLPESLGALMFTGEQLNRPVQVLLLIRPTALPPGLTPKGAVVNP